jgi:hypothetical protein
MFAVLRGRALSRLDIDDPNFTVPPTQRKIASRRRFAVWAARRRADLSEVACHMDARPWLLGAAEVSSTPHHEAGARALPPIQAVERLPAGSTTWCKFRTCSRAGGRGWWAA